MKPKSTPPHGKQPQDCEKPLTQAQIHALKRIPGFKYKLSCEMKDFLLESVGLKPRCEA